MPKTPPDLFLHPKIGANGRLGLSKGEKGESIEMSGRLRFGGFKMVGIY